MCYTVFMSSINLQTRSTIFLNLRFRKNVCRFVFHFPQKNLFFIYLFYFKAKIVYKDSTDFRIRPKDQTEWVDLMDFEIMTDVKMELNKNETIKKYMDLSKEIRKLSKMILMVIANCSWCDWNGPQKFRKKTRRIENKNRDLQA